MRVEVNMTDAIRGLVAKYSNETGKTMPESYRDLLVYGLIVSDVDFSTFRPETDLNEDLLKIAELDEDEYELVIEEKPEN